MRIWTFLYILSMFLSVTVSLGGDWFLLVAVRRRDVVALRATRRIAGPVERIGSITLFTGILFGLVAAVVSDFDLTSPEPLVSTAISTLILVLIIVDMVLKPF